MIPLKALVLCSLLFTWGCLGIPSKALDETYWSNDVFLRNEEQHMIQGMAIDDKEISAIALKIWDSVKNLNVQYDGVTRKKKPLKLFTENQAALRLDPYFKGLFNFYNARQGIVDPCVRTSACKDAQNRFLENISQDNGPIWILHGFLTGKGLLKGKIKAFKESLQNMWFTAYNRSGGVLDSSGFEHVFLGEITKKGAVSGLHNWMRMYDEDLEGRFKLTDDAKYFPTQKPAVAFVNFTWNGCEKRSGSSFFMKKSPAVEMALYTLCFMVRPNKNCPIDLGSFQLNVATFAWRANTDLISTAFPVIPRKTEAY